MKRTSTIEERREAMSAMANKARATADEMVTLYDGCDDPLFPTMPFDPQPFRDWVDFYERVIIPLATSDVESVVQDAMRLYRQANPHFIAACFYLAARADPTIVLRMSPGSRTVDT